MEKKIDEELYNRQLYVLGHEAMQKLQKSNVLIIGLDGLGVEIAKNVILAGVNSLTIMDNTIVTIKDLSSQFYLSENDVGKTTIATASLKKLRELNRYVVVNQIEGDLSENSLNQLKLSVVVASNIPLQDSIVLNNICRKIGAKFVSATLFGLFGGVFVDNGAEFVVKDVNDEIPKSGIIETISRENPGLVLVSDEKRHSLSTGDKVKFAEIKGMSELNFGVHEVTVKSPYTFTIGDTSNFGEFIGGGVFTQVKESKKLNFLPLEESLKSPKFVLTDFTKTERPKLLLALHQTLSEFYKQKNRKICPISISESIEAANNAFSISKCSEEEKTKEQNVIRSLARCSSAFLSPMASTIGGIAAQEVIKAVSGKFTPIQQHMYFDASECLLKEKEKLFFAGDKEAISDFSPSDSRYDDSVAVFGKSFVEKMANLRIFLVGAGAIGCEMLKNWAMMGVSVNQGGINVTDMDSIEKSNLNRQFLFRNSDVGELKSKVAADAIKKMNPNIKVYSQSNRVGAESETIYNTDFWVGLDLIVNALDNVETRLYVDGKCVTHEKPLFESGTLGAKGNTQVIIPHMTESYGSSRDPPEESVPMCTLKNFPNKIDHTIQWARDVFEGLFKQAPEDANNYIERKDFIENLLSSPTSVNDTVKNIKLMLSEKPKDYRDCLIWARCYFEEVFRVKIEELLFAFPPDHLTSSGTKFWSGAKRAPTKLIFDPNDKTHSIFVISAANLLSKVFNITVQTPRENLFREAMKSAVKKLPVFVPNKKIKIATTDEEMERNEEENSNFTDVEEIKSMLPPKTNNVQKLNELEFEKDDATNFHMDFVTACANLRARNYGIPEATLHQCKLVAGKIIPAIATTTALVSGLVCLEMYKYIQKVPLEDYKNGFVNLSLPLVTFSEPIPPQKTKSQLCGKDWEFTLWDVITVDESNITLRKLLKYFKSKLKLNVEIMSCNPSIIYASFFSQKDVEAKMDRPLERVIEEATKKKLRRDENFALFEAEVETLDGVEVEIPSVKVVFRK